MAKGAGARDMTEGSPMKLIWGFFVPMVFGLLFQQLYNLSLIHILATETDGDTEGYPDRRKLQRILENRAQIYR